MPKEKRKPFCLQVSKEGLTHKAQARPGLESKVIALSTGLLCY